jgi:50S ribosome-binding GTPase
MTITPQTIAALADLRQSLPRAVTDLNMDFGEGFDLWCRTLDRKLLPRLHKDFPLVAAICGGGSTGKSTLFNSLVGRAVSPMGGRAGLNRRVLIGLSETRGHQSDLINHLGLTFGGAPQPLKESADLLNPGDPLYCTSASLPARVLLLDTPDIDTGAQGAYTNRDQAQLSLEVADLFIYIFTNATYNNLDNTNFIARMFTGMGIRPCYLVYRVYPSFSDEEVRDHARSVAHHIYGPGAVAKNVLGVYRADEDNAVAAGERPVTLQPVGETRGDLKQALETLDPTPLRMRLLGDMFADAAGQAGAMGAQVRDLKVHLDAYARALENAQERSVQVALSHFPADRVLRRFAKIWLASDPGHIKVMRRTGKVVEWPLKTVLQTVQHFSGDDRDSKPPSSEEALERKVEMDLLTAANQLYQQCLEPRLHLGAHSAVAPAVVHAAQAELAAEPWQPVLEMILARKDELLGWSGQLDAELRALADQLRSRMGLLDQIRQTFAALLNVIPATAAITYILTTGDPVGGAGIQVKLTGIFGLHDLYALIAIPATAGMSKADRKQLEQLLTPLARTWLAHKFTVVRDLFETHITGRILDSVHSARERTAELTAEIDAALKTINP